MADKKTGGATAEGATKDQPTPKATPKELTPQEKWEKAMAEINSHAENAGKLIVNSSKAIIDTVVKDGDETRKVVHADGKLTRQKIDRLQETVDSSPVSGGTLLLGAIIGAVLFIVAWTSFGSLGVLPKVFFSVMSFIAGLGATVLIAVVTAGNSNNRKPGYFSEEAKLERRRQRYQELQEEFGPNKPEPKSEPKSKSEPKEGGE